MRELPTLSAADEAQREAVYLAQEAAEADWPGSWDDDRLEPDAVAAFVATTLERAGWSTDQPPLITFDVHDDSIVSGWADFDGIHLHPRLLSPWTILHELAHWLDPRAGHRAQFCINFLELLEAGLGTEARTLMEQALDERGAIY